MKGKLNRFLLYTIILSNLVWTAVLGYILYRGIQMERANTRIVALAGARANFSKDNAFRLWVSRHGGVYVPATVETPPDPVMNYLPERDITTPSGKKLTLVNPNYALRQMMDDYTDIYGIQGRIFSLYPHHA